MRNKRRLLVISETGANEKCPKHTVALPSRYRIDLVGENDWTYIHSPQSKCDTVARTGIVFPCFVKEFAGLRFAFVFAKCCGKQESPPTFILSNKERKKHRKIPFLRYF